jgi:transposase
MARTSTPGGLLPAKELGCGSATTCWRRFDEGARAGVFEQLQALLAAVMVSGLGVRSGTAQGLTPIATTISRWESQSTAPLPPSSCGPPGMSSAVRRSSMPKCPVRSEAR